MTFGSKCMAVAAVTVAACMTMLASQARADDFATIKAAAIKEGQIVVWHNSPQQEATAALAALFNKRFGMNIKVERVGIAGGEITSRMMTEKRGGRVTVDVLIAFDRNLPALVKNNLIEKVDWIETFAGPDKIDAKLLERAATNVVPEYKDYGLEFSHGVFGIAYNTNMLSEQDVPHTWEGLADPKWKGKVIVDAGLSPLARLLPAIGRDGVIALAEKVVANRPIYSDGQPASATKVVSGEAPLSMLTLSSALYEKQKGAPIGLVYPEPQALVSQQMVYVAKGAPHPNLARLWAAWLASEGMESKVLVDEGMIRAWPGSAGPFGEYYAKNNLKVRRADTIQELEDANDIRKDLDAVAAGRLR